MKIAIAGTGYVGLVSGTCFAEMGVNVICADTDSSKIELLQRGGIPIYEPGLEELVHRNVNEGRLHFTTDLPSAIRATEALFVAVGTPPLDDGSADLSGIESVAREFGRTIERYTLLVIKSTVPVGTSARVKEIVRKELEKRNADIAFDIADNPEFLKEGAAIKDFMSPDRIVVGTESERARQLMTRLYRPFLLNNFRVIFTDIASAEMIKYASNAMLATRISFMNEIANLCELTGADVDMVRKGMGSDQRIGSKFLYAGCGYGGSCFPKDVRALAKSAEEAGCRMKILDAVEEVNNAQKRRVFEKLEAIFNGNLKGRRIAIWGLSFKPETDDIREAPSLTTIGLLLDAGADVTAFDPVATESCRRTTGDRITYADNMYDAVRDADALLLLTEWKQFRLPSWSTIAGLMRRPLVIDGRNIYDAAEMRANGFEYAGIGKQ